MAKPMQYCKVITITPIKINKFIFKKGKKKKKKKWHEGFLLLQNDFYSEVSLLLHS